MFSSPYSFRHQHQQCKMRWSFYFDTILSDIFRRPTQIETHIRYLQTILSASSQQRHRGSVGWCGESKLLASRRRKCDWTVVFGWVVVRSCRLCWGFSSIYEWWVRHRVRENVPTGLQRIIQQRGHYFEPKTKGWSICNPDICFVV